MRCHEFDANIEEILSGAALPEADEHMRECERCTSRFRARTAVQNGLRHLAAAPLAGPSRATDRAVMASYRSLRQRSAAETAARPAATVGRLLSFPGRASALRIPRIPMLAMRPQVWMSGAAAAAVAVAVLGVGLYRTNHISPAGHVPSVASVPAVTATHADVASKSLAESSAATQGGTVQAVASENNTALAAKASPRRAVSQSAKTISAPAEVVLAKKTEKRPASARTELASAAVAATPQVKAESTAVSSPLLHLASSGAAGAVGVERAPSVRSTWPGYSNLMYCDPVICSGPMPVVRIRVPVGPSAPSAQPGGGTGESFVNADVVIGPDGVARAIRVGN